MLPVAVAAFFVENRAAMIFYAIVILLIILFRRKLTWQGIAGLYKTKIGLRLMERWGTKYRGLVQVLGYIGIGVGFIGMAAIVFLLGKGMVDMFSNPAAPPVVSPVIPGFSIWGHDLKVPLITGWLALFVVIVIHEFSHGVVSRAHNVPVKSSGLLVFGPILGAFVEPEEKKLAKEQPAVQYSLFAAGPWSNILSAAIFTLILGYLLAPAVLGMTMPGGVEIASVTPGYPAAEAGIISGVIVTSANGVPVEDYSDLSAVLDTVGVAETITLGTTNGDYVVTTGQNPKDADSTKGFLGVTLGAKRLPKSDEPGYRMVLAVVTWLKDFVNWIVILSLGIGLANLLPIGPIDGGRMLQTASRQITGNEKRGDFWWKRISLVALILIVVLLLFPIVRAVL